MNDDETIISLKKCPMHMPEGWVPPVPGYAIKASSSDCAVVLYVGIQGPTPESLEEFNKIISTSALSNSDLATFTDRAGRTNYVLIAYFDSSHEHLQWEQNSGFKPWWDSDVHLAADYGLWMEKYAFEPGQFETLISTPDGMEGVARRYDATVGPLREHGYWGGMEDRIPNSGPGKLAQSLEKMPEAISSDTRGKRIVVQGPANLCLIRSGQDLTAVGADELADYNRDIEPHLDAGLKFLAENADTGCFESRYMTHCDAQGNAIAKTFGMQIFLSIAQLAHWAQFHPTHLAIFNTFQDMAMEREGQLDIRLWHEVAVMDEGDSYAEYVNCDPLTGLLPFAHAL